MRDAHRQHSPQVIALPEAFTSPNMYDPKMRSVAVPIDGAPYEMLRRLARELDCTIGGGYLAKRGTTARNTYVLADPDGTTNLHDKDEPSVWEYAYYTGGTDPGVFTHPLGTIGLACGWAFPAAGSTATRSTTGSGRRTPPATWPARSGRRRPWPGTSATPRAALPRCPASRGTRS